MRRGSEFMSEELNRQPVSEPTAVSGEHRDSRRSAKVGKVETSTSVVSPSL